MSHRPQRMNTEDAVQLVPARGLGGVDHHLVPGQHAGLPDRGDLDRDHLYRGLHRRLRDGRALPRSAGERADLLAGLDRVRGGLAQYANIDICIARSRP